MPLRSRTPYALMLAALAVACAGDGGAAPDYVSLIPDGSACEQSAQCHSGHCDSGLCCSGGTCCATAAACPDAFRAAPACTVTGSATDCQGTRQDATCENYRCGSVTVEDDRACAGQVRDCGAYRQVTCTSNPSQDVAACATRCSSPTDCATGFTCIGDACVKIVGTGDACSGTGQGTCTSAALKCQNGVCCDATAGTCCKTAANCSDNLACDAATSTCFTSCAGSSSRCASPTTQYCAANVCYSKNDIGTSCVDAAQCKSGACECFDASCVNRMCRSTWCGPCQYATGDSTCVGGMGSNSPVADPNPADACSGGLACFAGLCKRLNGQGCTANDQCGSTSCIGKLCAPASGAGGECDVADGAGDCQAGFTCIGGFCRKANGQACQSNVDCESGVCECSNAACSAKICHAGACGVCQYATSATGCTGGLGSALGATRGVQDLTPGECDGTRACFAGKCLTDFYGTCQTSAECGSGECLQNTSGGYGRCADGTCFFMNSCSKQACVASCDGIRTTTCEGTDLCCNCPW